MDDDHLKSTVMTPDEFHEALQDPENHVRCSDRLGTTTIKISRVRVDEPLRIACGSFLSSTGVGLPIVLDHCVFRDLELYGDDVTTEGTRPEVDLIECGLPRIRIFNRFSWIRVVKSSVGEAQFDGTIASLVLSGQAEKTMFGGSIEEIWLNSWNTDRMFVFVDEDCVCRATSVLEDVPLTVRTFAATNSVTWARAIRLLCPDTPIVFNGPVSALART